MTSWTRRDAIRGLGTMVALGGAGAMTAEAAAAPPVAGRVAVDGGSVAYWTIGEGNGIPILTVHGGPGASHLLLTPLAGLGKDRPVIFWDELDCGESDRPHNPAAWTIDRFAAQIEAVRAGLGLEEFHLFGSSIGGCFASEYASQRPKGLKSCILAGP